MLGTLTEAEPTTNNTGPDDLWHVYCNACHPHDPPVRGMCGTELQDRDPRPWTQDPDTCIVCVELADLPCKECGA